MFRELRGICAAAAAVAALTAVCFVSSEAGRASFPEVRTTRPGWQEAATQGVALQAPDDGLVNRQLSGPDLPPAGAYERAIRHAGAIGAATASSDRTLATTKWSFVGPANIGGRVLDVVVDPVRRNTIYVAAASGGVWVSSDGGKKFRPAWPGNLTQAIGALAITRRGVLLAGTGETGPGGGSLTYGGTGIYRSQDRGKTWRRVGLAGSSRIGRIVVDPRNDRRIFAAVSGSLFVPGGERGLYRSTDGGTSWKRVLEGDNATTGAVDVAIDPFNPRRVYAATWDHQRTPDLRRYEGPGSGVWRSDDGGDAWTRIGSPHFGPNPEVGRIGLAVAPKTPGTVFATVSGGRSVHEVMWVSTDGGDTWTARSHHAGDILNLYPWWFGRIWIDPNDERIIYVAGVDMAKSTDGGVTFDSVGGLHADQHAMAWDPRTPGRVYLGNDGGVYVSSNGGRSWTFAAHQPWSQLYTLDVGEQDPSRRVAGLQDNGEIRSWGEKDWNEYGVGGDGLRTLINPKHQNIVYACLQYGECAVMTDGGDDPDTAYYFTERVISERKNWLTPVEFDPVDPSIVYTGGNRMSRSDDDAQNWTLISPDLSNGPGRETHPLFRNYGTLTTISPARRSTGTIYAGTDDGNVWATHDGGATWVKAADPDLPKAWVTRVQVHPANPRIAYATFSGFRTGSTAAYVLVTRDGGTSWANVTGNLPRAPVNDANVIGDALVVASDVGVFLSRDGGRRWLRVGSGLPLAPVHELRWHARTRTLYVATFGRGMWKVKLPATPARRAAGGPLGGSPVTPPAIALAALAALVLARRVQVAGIQPSPV